MVSPVGDCGAAPPAVAFLGSFTRNLVPRATRIMEVELGLARETRQRHRAALHNLRAKVDPQWERLRLDLVLILHHRREMARLGWAATTAARNWGHLVGALSRADYYTQAQCISTATCRLLQDFGRYLDKRSNSANVRFPVPAGREEIEKAISMPRVHHPRDPLTPEALRVLLIVTWISAGRFGDVLSLKVGDLRLLPASAGAPTVPIEIAFLRGKGAKMRKGGYTVPTALNLEWAALVRNFLQGRQATEWLFPAVSKQTRLAMGVLAREVLRHVNPQLEQKSVRRGALQALSNAGVPEQLLLLFSGHATVKMLRRYLGWKPARAEASLATAGASILSC